MVSYERYLFLCKFICRDLCGPQPRFTILYSFTYDALILNRFKTQVVLSISKTYSEHEPTRSKQQSPIKNVNDVIWGTHSAIGGS